METILVIVGAAALYLLVLPLFGLLMGVIARILLPYGGGILLLYVFVSSFNALSHVVWYSLGSSLFWVAIMLRSRSTLQKHHGGLAWYEGHYSSMLHILTLSQSTRFRKKVYST